MRKILAAISLLFLVSICAYGQGATGQMTAQGATCAVSGACVTTPTIPASAGAAAFTISGNTGSNTIQFEASADNQTTWVALNVTPTNSTTAVTSATGNGTWQANIAGYTNLRLRTSTYVSGTPQGTINISYASARSGGGGGGGGGGGTVTSVTIAGTANQVTASGTCTITTTGTCTLSQPNAVILGTDGSAAGTEQLANGSAAAHTILGSVATTSNTVNFFATAPTTGDLVDCVTATTVCTLTDSGVLAAQVVTSAASLTSNAVVLGAGSQGTKVSTGITTNGASEVDLGLNGTASGVLGFNGSTSGKATFTAPAVAGTSTNAIVSTNVLQLPAGAAATTAIQFANTANTGIYGDASHMFHVIGGGVDYAVQGNGNFILDNNTFGWTPNVTTTGADLGISRTANGVLAIGTGAQGSTAGQVKTAAYMSVGTTFTSNAGCTEGTLVGGATAGKFTVGQATACTIIITMGNGATAPNGWACAAYDQTAVPAVAIRQTASTTTTASLLMTVATNDVVTFHCIGY